jgi:uncharacterized protein DUF4962
MKPKPTWLLLAIFMSGYFFYACSGSVSAPPDGTNFDAADGGQDAGGDGLDDGGDAGADPGGDTPGDGGDSAADPGPDGGDNGQPAEQDWEASDKSYRQIVTLQPHPDRDRIDLPVIALIEHPDSFVLRGISVYEISGGMQPVPVDSAAWCQPGGRITQAGFEATGTTPAGQTREFAVYYNTAANPEAWQWSDSGWATRQQLPGGPIGVSGGCCAIQREVDEGAGTIRSGRRTGQETGLTLLASGWKVAEGFANGYQLESGQTIYPPSSVEAAPYAGLNYDGDDFQAALAANWESDVPVTHGLTLTQRVFRNWPFTQYLLSVDSAVSPLNFSSNDWNGRHAYLTDTYDRMVADVFADTDLAREWNTGMRWLVIYDSSSGRGFGWFTFHKGVVRADNDAGPTGIFDSYGYSAGATLRLGALWMASENKDEIIDLFDALKPGVRISDPESRDLNILEPKDGSYWFPEDSLQVQVSTPGNSNPVTAFWTLPDASQIPVTMARVGNTWIWVATTPLLLDNSHPAGAWTLTAQSGTNTRQATIEVRQPVHPRLLFSAGDLAGLRARKDGAHSAIWDAMLAEAGGYSEPIDDPGPGRDIRSYANRLINLALIQLIDPGAAHDDMLWTYFFKMLRYPNWTDDENPFNNLDLTVGHFLTALALTYDWHYDRLTPLERRELRTRLADMADVWLGTGHMRHYPDIDWTRYGTVTNNHYWINHQGIAATAFVLRDEVPDARRQPWEDRTEANLAVVLSVLEDDGASNEGVAYHSYGQINLFPWLDMRDRALGGQTALAIPWFENSILWDLYSIAPGGTDNYGGPANFGDCPPYHYNPPRTIQSWLASRLGNPTAQWMAEQLQWPRQTAYSYLWYDPSVTASPPDSLPNWHLADKRGIFAWRSSWENDAAYFSLKSGSYFGGHEQPDAGHFILHRAGVPYLTDFGYSYWKMTDEHNLILVDGAGQYGQDRQWMASVDPANWAGVPFALGAAAYFDLLADPTPMIESTDLQSWQREVIGLGPAIFIIRDVLLASSPAEFTWLLHSYRTDPPSTENQSYAYRNRRLENPWQDQGAGRWQVTPQDAAAPLFLADCSADNWTAVIEPSFYIPEQKLDVGGYNSDFESFQLGHRLRRTRTAASATSLVAAWFGADISVEALANAEAEGARLFDTNGDIALVIWPFAAAADLQGLSVNGAMAGRRQDETAYFGRALTQFEKDGQLLIQATEAVSLFARTEHIATADDPRFATVQTTSDVVLDLYCPVEPSQVQLDGTNLPFSWSNSILTVDIPSGAHRIVLY